MKILYISKSQLPDNLADYAQRYLNANFETLNDFSRVIETIKKTDQYELLIINASEVESKFIEEIYNISTTIGIKGLFLYPSIGEYSTIDINKTKYPLYYNIELPLDGDEFIHEIKNSLGLDINNDSSTEYYSITPTQLLENHLAFCDVYIQISHQRYIKIIRESDPIDKEVIDKFVLKGAKEFYINKREFGRFSDLYFNQITGMTNPLLDKNKESKQEEFAKNILDLALKIGVSRTVVERVNVIAEANIKLLQEKDKKIKSLIKIAKQTNKFLYAHSVLTSYIAVEIADRMNWSNYLTNQKLVFAGLLHDLTLGEDINLLTISNLETEDVNQYDWRIIKKIKSHPVKAAELVSKSKNIPPDVDKIILNHHERPDGSGFPKGLTGDQIFPLGCIFIIAEEFVHRIFLHDYTPELVSQIINDFESTFNSGNFVRPFAALKEMTLPEENYRL